MQTVYSAPYAEITLEKMTVESEAATAAMSTSDKWRYLCEILNRQEWFLDLIIKKKTLDDATEVQKKDYQYIMIAYQKRVEATFSRLIKSRATLDTLRSDAQKLNEIIDAKKPGTIREAKKQRTQLMKDIKDRMSFIENDEAALKRLGVDL
jgi:hypothetical protein